MNAIGRALVVGLLAVSLLGVGVHYEANHESHWPYPTSERLDGEYDSHVGERTLLFGTVESIDRDERRAAIRVDHDSGAYRMTVRGIDADVAPGGVIQVYGTLEADRTIAASNVVVVNRSPRYTAYKWAASGVGALAVLVGFFRYWRINLRRLSLEVR